MKKLLAVILAGLIISWFISGCSTSPVYMIAARATSENDVSTIALPELSGREDIITLARETGESLGYKIAGVSTEKMISMTMSSDSAVKKLLLPGGTRTMIIVMAPFKEAADNYKEKCPPELFNENTYREHLAVKIFLRHTGYWGAGSKEEGAKLLEQFKESLLAKANATRK
jgi:hypothetical protein